jgi:hypothetical protein
LTKQIEETSDFQNDSPDLSKSANGTVALYIDYPFSEVTEIQGV